MAHVFGIWCESRVDALIIRSMIAQMCVNREHKAHSAHKQYEKKNEQTNEQVLECYRVPTYCTVYQKIRHNISKVKNSGKINSV